MANVSLLTISRLARLGILSALLLPLRISGAGAAIPCDRANSAQVRLQVTVRGMRTSKGRIVISIYPDVAKEFLKGRFKLGQQHPRVVLPETSACFVVPASGYYAVALFGDEKNNNHFELTALGLPAEGYGFSNNPHLYFGPPGLARVRFAAHAGDNRVAVEMQYYP